MAALIQEVSLAARRAFANGLKDPGFQENFNELVKLMSRVRGRDVNFDVALTQRNNSMGRGERAPVTYIHLFEDQCFSMGIFVLRENARIPLHDHPGMYGLIKVIHGSISVKSFDHVILPTITGGDDDNPSSSSSMSQSATTTTDPISSGKSSSSSSSTSSTSSSSHDVSFKKFFPESAKKSPRLFLEIPLRESSVNDDCCILTPTTGNIHEVKPSGGPAAFLDILAPPYDMETSDRRCFYYERATTKVSSPTSDLLDKYPNNKLEWLVQVQQPSDFWCDEAEYEGPELP